MKTDRHLDVFEEDSVTLQKVSSKATAFGSFNVFVTVIIYLTLRRLMSYIYGAPILDVSKSHTTTQHSR